jgi:mannose-6-phosphate isomerase-like protein (cupin superfamily)
MPFGHTHSEQEEIYVVAEGSGRIKIGDEVHDVRQWDIVRVGPGVMRNPEAGPDGMTLIAFGAPLGEQSDGEVVPGWWSDGA